MKVRATLVPPSPARLTWLDLFRGACVVGMVETHVLHTFLVGASRETPWYLWLNYFNGLIAPAFLFIAGYVQGLGMRHAEGAHRNFGRKARRLAGVWLLGYALHFPTPQLLAGQWSEALRLGTQVDVLQCLAVSLAVLLAAEYWARRWVDGIAKALATMAVLGTGMIADWHAMPAWILGYFNSSEGSLFPLFPWAGFICTGFLVSSVTRWIAWDPAFNVALLFAFASMSDGSLGFFAQRLAVILVAVPPMQWFAARWQPAWLLFVGRESLVFYAAHLVLIEIFAMTVLPRAGFGVAACAMIFAAVLATTAAIALVWTWRRTLRRS